MEPKVEAKEPKHDRQHYLESECLGRAQQQYSGQSVSQSKGSQAVGPHNIHSVS
jgi:hypothetical protein